MKEKPSDVRIDPRTGEIIMSADTFLKGVSAREDAVTGGSFDELRNLMEEGPGGEESEKADSPRGIRDSRGIKTITELDYKGRLSGGSPKDALQLGKRTPTFRPPKRP